MKNFRLYSAIFLMVSIISACSSSSSSSGSNNLDHSGDHEHTNNDNGNNNTGNDSGNNDSESDLVLPDDYFEEKDVTSFGTDPKCVTGNIIEKNLVNYGQNKILHDTPKKGIVTFENSNLKKDTSNNLSFTWKLSFDNKDVKDSEVVCTGDKLNYAYNFKKAGLYTVSLNIKDSAKNTTNTVVGTIFIPKKEEFNIDLDEQHSFISIPFSKSLYSFGSNESGKLCLASSIKNTTYPALIKGYDRPENVGTGKVHSVFVNNKQVYTCGENFLGQLGVIDSNVNKETNINHVNTFNLPNGYVPEQIVLAVGGKTNSIGFVKKEKGQYDTVESDKIRLYAWGGNFYPSYTDKDEDLMVSQGTFETKNPLISIGNDFVVTRLDFNILSYGENKFYQLGRVDNRGTDYKTSQEELDKINPEIKILDERNKGNNFDSREGYVYTPYGEEGKFDPSTQMVKRSYYQSNQFAKIATGEDFVLTIKKSEKGQFEEYKKNAVYVWGNNDQNQLGFDIKDTNKFIGNPTAIFHSSDSEKDYKNGKYLNKERFIIDDIVDIAAGKAHSLALSKTGKLYGFGDNSKKQLTDDAYRTANIINSIIYEIDNVDSLTYKNIWAGGNRSIALLSDGNLYTWGENTNGIAGIASNDNLIEFPSKIYFELNQNK